MQKVSAGQLFRVPVTTEGLALSRGSLPMCPTNTGAGTGTEGGTAGASVIPVAAAAAAGGAVLAGAVIGVVCWKRRSRRNACKTKLVATAGRAPVDPDTLPKYEYPDINLLELAPMTPKGNTASGRVSGVGPSETAYSVLGQQRAVYTENVSYTSLARDRHRTYTQTSEMMLPGQIFAAAAAAVAYEEPVPTRRFTRHERPSTATPQGSKVNPTFFHSFSDDEQTA